MRLHLDDCDHHLRWLKGGVDAGHDLFVFLFRGMKIEWGLHLDPQYRGKSYLIACLVHPFPELVEVYFCMI